MRTAKAQIRLRTAQSDQGLSCPLTESFVTIECIGGERMPGRDFAHAWVEPEVGHFAHAGRYIFVWCGSYESHLLLPVQSVKCILSVNGIYSKYWDTLTPYHTCTINCKSLFHYLLMSLKYCWMRGKQCRS